MGPSSTARPRADIVIRRQRSPSGDAVGVPLPVPQIVNGKARFALEVTLNRRGIRFTHSRPYHPQTCGKVERFHQTEKRWLATQPQATTIARLQRQLDNSSPTTTPSVPI